MKKTIRRMLVFVLCLAIVAGTGITGAFSVAGFSLRLDAVKAYPGEIAEYDLLADSDVGISAFDMTITYDASKLTLLEAKPAGALAQFIADCSAASIIGLYAINTDIAGKISVSFAYDAQFNASGSFFSLKFYASGTPGVAAVAVDTTVSGFYDIDSDPVLLNVLSDDASYYEDEIAVGSPGSLTALSGETPADYTALNAAAALIPADMTVYTNASAGQVSSVQSLIVPNLGRSRQGVIDSWTSQLLAAVDALEYKTADYSRVTAAVNAVPDDMSGYNASGVAAVNAALNSIVYGLDIRSQAAVTNYAIVLEAATAALTVQTSQADYSGVAAAIGTVPEDLSNFTPQSIGALNAAITAIHWGLPAEQQTTVNGYAAAVSAAVSGLALLDADYSAVNVQLARVPANLSDFSNSQAVSTAVSAVVAGKKIDEQELVDGYALALKNAVDALTLKSADYSAVTNALSSVPSVLSNYLPDGVSALNSAISAVVYGLDITKQAQVNLSAAAVVRAVSALVLKGADYSAVNAAAASVPSALGNYTESGVAAVLAAVRAVDYTKKITQQSEVDEYALNISSAVSALVLKRADYTAVNLALSLVPADLSSYSLVSADALRAAVAAVVPDLDITEQARVNGFSEAIIAAINALTYGTADYSAVDSALSRIPADSSLYTSASYSAVTRARDAVIRGLNADRQAEVDAMAAVINAAVDALAYADADYSRVNAAIARKPSNFKMLFYSSASKQKLNNAINAVNWNLKKNNQAMVNKYADDINAAVDGLTNWFVALFKGNNSFNSSPLTGLFFFAVQAIAG